MTSFPSGEASAVVLGAPEADRSHVGQASLKTEHHRSDGVEIKLVPGGGIRSDRRAHATGVYALTSMYGDARVSTMTTAFAVLAEPNRRRLLDLLCDGERPVGELVLASGLSQPSVSKHLRVLKEAGLVVVRPDAQRRYYALRPGPLLEIDAWLAPYRRAWAGRLDALERHLDELED
jgi:DNA-binding transcriptional ArsR family regulator